MHKLGKKQMIIELEKAVNAVPDALSAWALELSADGSRLTYTYDPRKTRTGIPDLLQAIGEAGLPLKDFQTSQSSLEEIFVSLVKGHS
jgi:ABC-2 type transport system ATP-binding protein